MKVNPNIFREYDIRGIAGREFSASALREYEKWYGPFPGITITEEIAEAIGRAYGTLIQREGGSRIVVGHELRPFADELANAFISGIRRTGCAVVDIGPAITPVVYFAVAHGHFDGGANITGSHNVYFFNGFKLTKKDVMPIFGEELQGLRQLVEREDFIQDADGRYEQGDFSAPYEDHIVSRLAPKRKLRVVIDCGNGSAGLFAPRLFRKLGVEVKELYTEPDATFPHHVPDPEARQNLGDLMKEVRATGADMGIAFDADGDRVGFVDERGTYVDADSALLVFARDVLKRFPGSKILFDVKGSQLLEELVPSWRGIPLMHRTGHAPIKETLRRDPAVMLAGEASGHFYFAEDYFRFDDGLFAAAKMLTLCAETDAAFSSLFADFPQRVRTPEIKLPCVDEKKFGIVAEIRERFRGRYPMSTIDGVRIKVSGTGWGLVRASNTSPYLTVRAEGSSEEEVLVVKNLLADELEKFPDVRDGLNRKEVATLTGKLGWV